MGVPTSEVGYASATTGRGDHEVYKGTCGIGKKKTRGLVMGSEGKMFLYCCGIPLWIIFPQKLLMHWPLRHEKRQEFCRDTLLWDLQRNILTFHLMRPLQFSWDIISYHLKCPLRLHWGILIMPPEEVIAVTLRHTNHTTWTAPCSYTETC
jgi:hypothetical protein